jgi:stringent starvation protein B
MDAPPVRAQCVSARVASTVLESVAFACLGARQVDRRGSLRYISGLSMATQSKRDIAESLLERGSVFVHLDPRIVGVAVPSSFRAQPQLVLQVGLSMPIPIPDLTVDDHGIRATLSFSRTPHRCIVPWEAVFALVGDDGRGSVFPESMPEEIRREVDREASSSAQAMAYEEDGEGDSLDDPDDDSHITSALGPSGDANVIPLWPRSVKGGSRTPSSAPGPLNRSPSSTSGSNPPPDKPRPRPPHPHLRRVK